MRYFTFNTSALALCLLASLTACGGSDSDGDSGENDNSAAMDCNVSSDCDDGFVCLEIAGSRGCAPTCEGQADECGASGSCGGVGVTTVDVCQEKEATEPTAENPPEPEEQPRLPCETDADCSDIQAGLICVEFQGQKDCTIPCGVESDCDLPSAQGIEIDLLACEADEADASRTGCVPDLACFDNPASCITVPGAEIPGGGLPGGF